MHKKAFFGIEEGFLISTQMELSEGYSRLISDNLISISFSFTIFSKILSINLLRPLASKPFWFNFSVLGYTGEKEDALFYDHATNGVLYDEINDMFNISRDESKNLMMHIVFGKMDNDTPHKEAFQKMYSKANRFIEAYKKENPENIQSRTINSKKDFYKSLPIRLQRMESDFWIDGVLTECYKRNINAISRHDSVTVHEKDKQEVINIIEELNKVDSEQYSSYFYE